MSGDKGLSGPAGEPGPEPVNDRPECPQCKNRTIAHCASKQCKWLHCPTCRVIFGKGNYFMYQLRAGHDG